MKKLALVLATIFHPLLIPTWGFLVLFLTSNPYAQLPFEYKSILWLIVFGFTFVVPVFFIAILKFFKLIDTFQMHHHQERILPMMIVFIAYFAAVFLLRKFNAPSIIPILITVSTISIGIAGIISIIWKISAHLTGMGGITASVLVMSQHLQANYSMIIALTILIAGAVGWSRLYLNAHNREQILAGFMLGFSAIYFPVFLTQVFG